MFEEIKQKITDFIKDAQNGDLIEPSELREILNDLTDGASEKLSEHEERISIVEGCAKVIRVFSKLVSSPEGSTGDKYDLQINVPNAQLGNTVLLSRQDFGFMRLTNAYVKDNEGEVKLEFVLTENIPQSEGGQFIIDSIYIFQ